MRAVLASMLLLAVIAGTLAGIIAWRIDFAGHIAGNRGFNSALTLASAGGVILGVGLLAVLRVGRTSILLAVLRGADRSLASALGLLGWGTLAVVGVSLYCLVFALSYGLLTNVTLRPS